MQAEAERANLSLRTVICVFLFAGGLMVFLLPFNLAASASNGFATGWIAAMIIIGFAMMVLFCVHEYYWATSPWLPWHFLADRSMVGTCALNMVYQISYYTWNLYFQSFLQVVFNLSIAEAGYINNTFSVCPGSFFSSLATQFAALVSTGGFSILPYRYTSPLLV
jgi:hypothetical protein